jgi:hypothetical protein
MSDINVIVNDEIVNIDVIDEPVLVNVINSPGVPGAPGQGVPVGGTTGQVLAKNSNTNYDTEWVDVSGGAWGTITGTLSNQTDLQTALDGKFDDPTGTTSQYLRGDGSLATFPSLTGYVPYTGATGDVNLGTHRILAQNATIASSGSGDTVTLTHSSGSGIGLNITKGGNGEGLYINKTGGSGNAATIIGTINATTLVKSGGTSSQFLKADGTVDSSVYVPTSRELTINGVTYDLSANRSWTVSGGISGSGASGQVAYWDGTTSQAGSNNLFWDNANGRLGIGTNAPATILDISSNGGRLRFTQSVSGSVFNGIEFATSGGVAYASLAGNQNTGEIRLSTNASYFPTFYASGSEGMRLTTNRNLLLQNGGTFTDGGQRLQVQGTTLLNGNVTFSSATGMTWDATNSRLGIGTNVPSELLTVQSSTNAKFLVKASSGFAGFDMERSSNGVADLISFKTSSTFDYAFGTRSGHSDLVFYSYGTNGDVLRLVKSNGNLLLQNGGTFTDSGERLQVTGDVKVVGSGATSGTRALTVQNSSTTNLFTVLNNGDSTITGNLTLVESKIFSLSGRATLVDTGGKTTFTLNQGGNTLGYALNLVASGFFSATSGTGGHLRIQGNITPSSGTSVYNMLLLESTINQTGTATGITRGLYVNPTLTAAADFRAIETARGNVVFGNLPTSPVGLPSGALWNNLGMINIV